MSCPRGSKRARHLSTGMSAVNREADASWKQHPGSSLRSACSPRERIEGGIPHPPTRCLSLLARLQGDITQFPLDAGPEGARYPPDPRCHPRPPPFPLRTYSALRLRTPLPMAWGVLCWSSEAQQPLSLPSFSAGCWWGCAAGCWWPAALPLPPGPAGAALPAGGGG